MTKIFVLFACLLLSHVILSSSTTINCVLTLEQFPVLYYLYSCVVAADPLITTRDSANVSDIDASPRKIFPVVFGFIAEQKTLHFFPKGLNTYFYNLELIKIDRCGLKVIQQSDLMPFNKLLYIDLSYNSIEVIEQGLFDYNPLLKVVGFWESKIIHIDPNVFDHLNKLRCFWLDNVPCSGDNTCDSEAKLKHAIGTVKRSCKNSEFVTLNGDIEDLKNDAKVLNYESFKKKFQNFERKFNASRLSNKFYLTEKVDNLRILP